jgi:hypothetical protein
MTNATKTLGLIMTLALWSGIAAGQGPMMPGAADEIPPDMALPTPDNELSSMTSAPDSNAGDFGSTDSLSSPQVDGYDLSYENSYPDMGGLWNQIAPIESSGTWLQRGFWYAEADAVIFNRLWDRDSLRVAAQDSNVNTPPVNNVSLGFNPIFLNTNRILIVDAAQPGEDAAVRATLGHFMFRDSRNRDHLLEFTTFGSGDWNQQRVITSEDPFGLFVPWRVDGGNTSFDNSSRQSIDYDSFFKSFESNYRVRQRMRRDQLVMDANGSWHRAANSGFEREWLVGLRFVQMGEKFDWRAEDIAVTGDDGRYVIRTKNDMFGFQMGTGITYQASRWSVGLLPKGGVYINDATGNTFLNFTADDTNDSNLRLRNDELSFVGEFKIQTRFHITPNTSLRAAYELMYISSVALAPSQATFIPVTSYLNTSGDPLYHGTSFGFEAYW